MHVMYVCMYVCIYIFIYIYIKRINQISNVLNQKDKTRRHI